MSKKKDHLFATRSLALSVLRGTEAVSVCGVSKVFKREDFDDLSYRDACAECIAGAASRKDPISIRTKKNWVELLEAAFIEETSPKVSVYLSGDATWNWTGATVTATTTTREWPPAA